MTRKTKLKRKRLLESGTEGVCLTTQIPDNKALISDFDAWHCVLNNWFYSLTEEEYNLSELGKNPLPKEKSWEHIFHIHLFPKSELWNNAPQILQGTTGKIYLNQIIHVQHFKTQ